ncbi:hypothetical protein DW352_08450 [Pseudolabrys taiwanensis]|uniref:Uncharacterized protein n=1 Tax=Pseudolabrys taiwanensis TaxID=331696 RepID=A0A345ZUE5_9HYPH|nr:hypothetical protein [Pseudolabrys taiwanensis]AXK80542.1 hypothetical protein DW352_08450 [Pseudolabrys taiwanensis]
MDKKIAGLLGAVAALSSLPSAQAAAPAIEPTHTADAMQVSSYADLLTPVPNAVAVLKADDAARAQMSADEAQAPDGVQVAQYYYHHHHHHHQIFIRRYHHHHHHWRRWHHHHHHHRYYRHHHHHHHSHYMMLQRDEDA